MVADSIKVAVLLAMHIAPDSHIGEQIPDAVVEMGVAQGLIGRETGEDGPFTYITDAGRDRMEKILEALA